MDLTAADRESFASEAMIRQKFVKTFLRRAARFMAEGLAAAITQRSKCWATGHVVLASN